MSCYNLDPPPDDRSDKSPGSDRPDPVEPLAEEGAQGAGEVAAWPEGATPSGEVAPGESGVPEVEPPDQTVVFEDLTLAQALGYLFWRPAQTARLFWQVLTRDPSPPPGDNTDDEPPSPGTRLDWRPPRSAAPPDAPTAPPASEFAAEAALAPDAPAPTLWGVFWAEVAAVDGMRWAWISLLALAILLAARGGQALYDAAVDPRAHATGDIGNAAGWFGLVAALFLAFEMVRDRAWWAARLPRMADTTRQRFAQNDLRWLWGGVLTLGALGTLLLAALVDLPWFTRLVLVVNAGVLWLAVVFGLALSEDDLPAPGSEIVPFPEDEVVIRSVAREATPAIPAETPASWWAAYATRLSLVPVALLFSALAYGLNVSRNAFDEIDDVVFTPGGFLAWVLSIALWVVILGVRVERVPWRTLPERFRALMLTEVRWGWLARLLRNWTFWALAGITLLGAVFRLHDISAVPPEMTSDHIEKLLDALRVHEGYRGVFFPNNGGREGFQMYMVALLAGPLGVGFSFDALKLATGIEGVITIPVVWWMARQVIGDATDRDRALGNWTGLALAGLVAISVWHVMLSRLGLRIVLTPLTTALVVGLLARVMRHDRARDYLALGATLGAGVYFYQANRMLPILVLAGIGLVVLARGRERRALAATLGDAAGLVAVVVSPLLVYWYAARLLEGSNYTTFHEIGVRLETYLPLAAMAWFSVVALYLRARSDHVRRYGGGLLMAAVVALAIYLPLYHYSEIHASEFWNRTRGRMFGEQAFWRTDPETGETVAYEPSWGEQAERFWDERAVFADNYADALRMYHWEGDGAWISNDDSRPALRGISGGLLILGAAMWGVWLVRRRDAVLWLVPLAVLVMLLPSAMTLAYTIENPSFTRASGTIPPVMLLAALPLGALAWHLGRLPWAVARVPLGRVAALVVLVVVLWSAIGANWDTFFTDYRLGYAYSWKPYSEIARPMREFAQSPTGSYGNAFMVAYPHWLDHRILGTMAGDIRWPNGLVNREALLTAIQRNQGTPYEYNPAKEMFVMYHPNDQDTAAWLMTWFPGGTTELYTYHYEAGEPGNFSQGQFYIYTVRAGYLE